MHLSNDLDLKESIIRFGKVLDRHEGPLRSLRVRHLFIDEFQDTDDAQIRVFSMLQKAINEQCRLFIVGDLKQSIYRFRGATLSAFQQIEQMSKFGWEKYSLTINYRTDSRLLDRFHSVFEKMGENDFLPYCEADRLTSSVFVEKTEDDLFACIPCHANDEEEFGETLLKVLSKQISLLNGLITQRDIRGEKPLSKAERTIAVLVRSNWQVDRIVSLGKRNGISIETKSGGDLFQLTPTQDLYKLLIALENSSNPVYLANLIESNLVGLELDYSTLRDLPLSECAKELIEVLDNFFEDRMGKTWQEVVNSAYAEPILFAIKQMYDSLRPWKNYSEKIPGQRHYKINYECLVETIAQSAKADTLTLNQIANYLKVSIVTQQERPSRELDFGDKEIEILCTTVHKSKGLEYGTVILPYTSAEIGSAAKIKLDANYVDSKLAYIATFENGAQEYNSNFDLLAETSEQVSEESRVLYVALTRAIRNFVWVKNLDSKAAISWGVLLEA